MAQLWAIGQNMYIERARLESDALITYYIREEVDFAVLMQYVRFVFSQPLQVIGSVRLWTIIKY